MVYNISNSFSRICKWLSGRDTTGKNLTSDEYIKNLISDLINFLSQISITNLQKALTALNQENLSKKLINLTCPVNYIAVI